MSSPSVSVIIPARDAERYIAEAIDSVFAQTSPADEIVVVDDGSEDGTAAVAERFGAPLRCLRCEPEGVAAALNTGLAESRGELIAFLDADDVWTPDRLELGLAALEREPGTDIVFGQVEQFLSPELDAEQRSRLRPPGDPVRGIFKGTMLARRGAFERVGEFATEWRLGEFVDWYARAQEAGLCVEVLPEVLVHRRLHATNMGVSEREARSDYARVLAAALKRRREAERRAD